MNQRIPWAKPSSFPQEIEFVSSAIRSNWLSDGEWLNRFEDSFARTIAVPHALSTSNGTTALQLALLAFEIGPGDEVIVPNFSFVAPGNMVIACGATPVLADIDSGDWNLSLEEISRKITARTKAVIFVHNFGITGDIEAIQNLCRFKKVALIEDVAEACFSKFKGRSAGTFGEIGCYSFQATKTITTGEGGMVVTSDPKLLERMKRIRSHGMDTAKRYWHVDVGFNFRLTNIQAALGCAQLENLDWILSQRQRIYETYCQNLMVSSRLTLQECNSNCSPAMWTLGVRINESTEEHRDSVREAMAREGIETRPGFYPYSRMPLYKAFWPKAPLPISEEVSKQLILLPFFPGLSLNNVERICKQLINHLN